MGHVGPIVGPMFGLIMSVHLGTHTGPQMNMPFLVSVVCSRWAFALGVHSVLSLWAAAAAAVAAAVATSSLCAVYLGGVQIKVHNNKVYNGRPGAAGLLSFRYRKSAAETVSITDRSSLYSP